MQVEEYRGEWVLSTILEERANRFSDKSFILTSGEILSYADVVDRASRVASGLRSLFPGDAQPVATMLDATPTHLFAWFGCAWSGVIEVPINTELKGLFLEHVLNESGSSVLILEAKYIERLQGLHVPQLRHLVVVGKLDEEVDSRITVHRLSDWFQLNPSPRIPCAEQDLLYILYTSGTTGPSKGVMHCNRSALWTARVLHGMLELTAQDTGYSFLPMFHTTARNGLIADALIAGASVAMRDRFSVSDFWEDIRRFKATYIAYMGAVIQMLWNQPPVPGEDQCALRVGVGAAAPPGIIDAFEERFGLRLIEVYGMTEIGTASGHTITDTARGTAGRPVSHLEIEIHDPEDRPVPAGTPGEIVVRPREPWAIMQGYWHNAEATAEAWRNLWFHTGDLGSMTETGYLNFHDRLKDSMRRRGENISSFEVEHAVQAYPAVREAAAYGVPSELTEDDVMVGVVLQDDAEFDPAEFFRFCSETMPRYAVPRYVRVLAELPKTPTVRVEKYKLRAEGVTADTHDREQLTPSSYRR